MRVSYNWLKEFVDFKKYPIPKLADLLTMNFAEVDSIEEIRDDVVLDLKILPDRASDCLSHFGIAREIAALVNLKLKTKNLKPKIKEDKKEKIQDILKVENQEPIMCKRYVSRVIKNVKIGSSPKWLKERLESLGQKSINNVVDATNYVMLELGQPLHAFDLDKVEDMQIQNSKFKVQSEIQNSKQIPKIIIRKAHKEEKITTLDNQEVKLSEDILVITNERGVLAIAGVKGGKNAEIDENTKNIILESANFSATSIRKASRLINIKTESSVRFAADLDPNLAGIAMERLTSLIVEIARGDVVGGRIDIYLKPIKKYSIGFSLQDADRLIGVELSEKEVMNILKRLNFKVRKISPQKEILKLVKQLKGKPYKYGASVSFDAPDAFDCSSFINYIFTQAGIQIPRISIDQYFYGNAIIGDAEPGDLIFSNSGKGKIYYESIEFMKGIKIKDGIDHVGVYLGKGKVAYATRAKSKVIIEDFEKSVFSKNFRGFRRIKDIEQGNIFVVDVPTYRRDISPKGTFILQKADVIEEIGRLYGYQNLKSKLPEGILVPAKRNNELYWESAAKNALVAAGFTETYNYSFIGERDLKFCHFDAENILALGNYISEDRKYLRPSLIAGFLNNIKENLKYFKDVRIFEIGKVFNPENKFIGGAIASKDTSRASKANEFYEIKAAIDLLLEKLGFSDFWYDNFKAQPNEFEKFIWHPSRSAEIKIGGEIIGFLGEISKQILQSYDINGRVAAFEIDFGKLARLATEEVIYRPISKYPAVERDLAIIVPLDIKVDDVLDVIENAGGILLIDTDLFDIYEGDNVASNMKSLAFHIVFQSSEKTLSEKDIEKIMNDILWNLNQKGWEVRTK